MTVVTVIIKTIVCKITLYCQECSEISGVWKWKMILTKIYSSTMNYLNIISMNNVKNDIFDNIKKKKKKKENFISITCYIFFCIHFLNT